MKEKFFITTPIYYGNGVLHVGHSYTSIITDVIARYKRINGFDVKFSTGIDENSQKAVLKAQEEKMEVMDYINQMAIKHKAVWDGLEISYTDFIRTTEKRHHDFVQKILQKTFENGDIYKGTYEGLYCVGCESFKKSCDLDKNGLCPDHTTKPEIIKEQNYFFKLSKYQKQLEELFEKNPDFVTPAHRFIEVKEFLKKGLEDFSLSRETNKFGIPLPFDPSQVTYVWYDALLNYLTVCQDGDENFWPVDLHAVGKEILRFHAIYWPAMLISAGYQLPKQIIVNGYLTIEGQKISKSLGNVIDPVEFSKTYSRDILVLYLLLAFPIGGDIDFTSAGAITMYNSKLANNIGNLLNRFIVLSLKIGGIIEGKMDNEISSKKDEFIKKYRESMDNYLLKNALELSFEFGDVLNKYLDNTKPWEKNPDTDKQELLNIMYTLGEGLRTIALALHPFFYKKMKELFTRIGLDYSNLEEIGQDKLFSETPSFTITEKGEALYPRI